MRIGISDGSRINEQISIVRRPNIVFIASIIIAKVVVGGRVDEINVREDGTIIVIMQI